MVVRLSMIRPCPLPGCAEGLGRRQGLAAAGKSDQHKKIKRVETNSTKYFKTKDISFFWHVNCAHFSRKFAQIEH